MELDKFTTAYLECALWSSTDDNSQPFDKSYSINDFSDAAKESAISECNDFRTTNAELLAKYNVIYSDESAGHDFWLTRNGHGAGFWDRNLGEVGKELTVMTKPYGESYVYLGDDGELHIQ